MPEDYCLQQHYNSYLRLSKFYLIYIFFFVFALILQRYCIFISKNVMILSHCKRSKIPAPRNLNGTRLIKKIFGLPPFVNPLKSNRIWILSSLNLLISSSSESLKIFIQLIFNFYNFLKFHLLPIC